MVVRLSPFFVHATGVSGLGTGASSSHILSFSSWRDFRTRLILFYNVQRLPDITEPPQSSLTLSLNDYATAVYARPIHYAVLFVILVKAATLYWKESLSLYVSKSESAVLLDEVHERRNWYQSHLMRKPIRLHKIKPLPMIFLELSAFPATDIHVSSAVPSCLYYPKLFRSEKL